MLQLSTFLDKSKAFKEAALIVADDFNEEKKYIELLEHHHYKRANSARDFCAYVERHDRVYLVASDTLSKELYDCLLQYPTGSVEIFDPVDMKPYIFRPKYKDSSVVVLITRDHLKKVQDAGFNILRHTGMTYQN